MLTDAKAQVMVKVPHGRMGHREAWWHMDRRAGEDVDWAWRRRGVADEKKEDVWLVRLGRGETVSGRKATQAVEALEDIGTHYVAGGLPGMELAWGNRRMRLGEDAEYIDNVGRWMDFGGRPLTAEECTALEKAEGIDMQATFASKHTEQPTTLAEGISNVRLSRRAWLRCGVVTDAVDWFAEHAAGRGRRKGQWATAVIRALQRAAGDLECTYAAATRLWAEYRGASAGAEAQTGGAYPCRCCKRWWNVVYITGETGGWSADAQELRERADAARGIQRSRLRASAARWSSIQAGTVIRWPVDDRSKNTVMVGTVVATEPIERHPKCKITGVRNAHAVLVKFTATETTVVIKGRDSMNQRRWSDA